MENFLTPVPDRIDKPEPIQWKQIAKEQVKAIWERCGYPEIYGDKDLPIDLNNLFRYAVPKAIEVIRTKIFPNMSPDQARQVFFRFWLKKVEQGYDYEDALFWTVWGVIGG